MAKAYVTLGFYNQIQKLFVLSAYCLFWEKKKAAVAMKERLSLPKYIHLFLISKVITVHCHWQQELCVTENIKFSLGWAQPR